METPTPLSLFDRSNRQKISKDIAELNSVINQLDLIDIYRLHHSATAGYTFYSSLHGTSNKTEYTLGHKIHFHVLETGNHEKYVLRL